MDPVASIESVKIIKSSSVWSTILDIIPIANLNDLWSIRTIIKSALSLMTCMPEWHLQENANTFEYIQHELTFCNVNNWLGSWILVTPDDFLGDTILHIWFSIFLNITYKVGDRWIPCLHYARFDEAILSRRLKFDLSIVENSQPVIGNLMAKQVNSDVIRFVTSRSRDLEKIGVHELVGYFDWQVWAVLAISILTVGFMLYLIANF